MSASLKLYGVPLSRTRRCLWTLEEVGADYEFIKLDFAKGEHQAPEYLKLNPNARVPAMVDEEAGVTLFESAAICMHVARKFPDAGLLPKAGSNEEALHDQWMYWVVTEPEQALWSMGKHKFALPKEQRLAGMQETALFEWRRATPVLAEALKGGPYILGETMHLVDIMMAHTLLWARGFNVPFEFDILEEFLGRMKQRPSFKAALQFD